MSQILGSATSLMIDTETSFGVPKASAQNGRTIPFQTESVGIAQAMNQSATLRGNRNATKPFVDRKDVTGDITMPVHADAIGRMMLYAIGAPTSVEKPIAATAGSDIKDGTPTIETGAAGAYTFSEAQDAVVGDRVIYQNAAGTRFVGYITTKTNTTTGVLSTTRDAGAACAVVAAGSAVIAICQSIVAATPGTVTIASGVATFSETQTGIAAGMDVWYDEAAVKKMRVVSVTTAGTVVAVIDPATGKAPADISSKTVEWIGKASYWTHTYKIAATTELASFMLQKTFPATSPIYQQFKGCKVESFNLKVTTQGELLAVFSIIGADMVATNYDASPVALSGVKFMQSDCAATEGGSAITIIKDVDLTHKNNLDPDSFCIGGGGVRYDAPVGIAALDFTMNAVFIDGTLLAKADGATESSLGLTFTSASDANTLFAVLAPEVSYERTSPKIEGPKGVTLALKGIGYYDNEANASQVVVTVQNQIPSYA